MTADFNSPQPLARSTGSRLALGGLILAAVFASAGPTLADALPFQRPGLWQSDMNMAGSSMSTKMCIDQAMAARSEAFAGGRAAKMCSKRSITHNLDGSWTSLSTCEYRPGQVRSSRMDISGDFKSKVMLRMTRPPSTTAEMTMTMTWMGPCLPGQKGGDLVMPNGRTMNVDPTLR